MYFIQIIKLKFIHKLPTRRANDMGLKCLRVYSEKVDKNYLADECVGAVKTNIILRSG